MSDFKAKVYQIQFWLGFAPYPAGESYSAPPSPLAGFKGPTSKGKEGQGGQGKEKEGKGEGKEEEGMGGKRKGR